MMNIGDFVRKTDNLAFQSRRMGTGSMIQNPISCFPRQIQPLPVLLQNLYYPDTLTEMGKSVRIDLIQRALTCMTEGSMSQIMSQRDRLYQILIQPESLCNRSRNLGYFQGMGKTVSVMISLRCQKYLGLIFQPPECLAVQNTIPVSLVNGTDITLLFRTLPSSGMSAVRSIRAQQFQFSLFHAFPDVHKHSLHVPTD